MRCRQCGYIQLYLECDICERQKQQLAAAAAAAADAAMAKWMQKHGAEALARLTRKEQRR